MTYDDGYVWLLLVVEPLLSTVSRHFESGLDFSIFSICVLHHSSGGHFVLFSVFYLQCFRNFLKFKLFLSLILNLPQSFLFQDTDSNIDHYLHELIQIKKKF